MDALSDILSGVKFNGALYCNAEFSAPLALDPGWVCVCPLGRRFPPLALEPGDVIMVPHGDPHLLSSETCVMNPQLSTAVERKVMTHDLSLLRGGGGAKPRAWHADTWPAIRT